MRVNRSLLGWGVFFIVLGCVPLAVRQGLISEDLVADAWQLWPLVLVGAGIGLVLRGTRAELVGGLIVAVTFGIMGGSLIATGGTVPVISACGTDGSGTAFARRQGELSPGAEVALELDCGEVTVGTASGSAWSVEGTDETGTGPEIASSGTRLRVSSRDEPSFGVEAGDQWTVTLPTDPDWRFDLTVNAGSADVDLSGARLRGVAAAVNAGSITLDLGDAIEVGRLVGSANAGSLSITLPARSLNGEVSANAGSVELCVPDGVGIRIETQENLVASYDFADAGLVKSGSTWETPGFGSADVRITLAASANAGSITLNPEDGCGE